MKTTGIVRKIDELGRVVLPIEMRKTLNLQIRDEVDNRCVFCASQENLQQFKGSWICRDCLQELVSK